ncbi:MAG: translocation/assembly module TamB domain-containing protein [Candidatus Didemnitutus sp.]|nr:translocation/assembly module TamB domain-containing protein [Candidatus Didemnitutus sp.]
MARWLKTILWGLLVLGVLLGSLPWWLGTALRPALRAQAIAFDRYERVGYARFRLHDVIYRNPNLQVTAGEVESLTPLVWLGQRLRGREPLLAITDWSVRIMAAPDRIAAIGADRSNTLAGVPDLQGVLRQIGPHLLRWLPRAQLAQGSLRGLGPEVTVASADWHNGVLTVVDLRVARHAVALHLKFAADGTVAVTAHTVANESKLHLVWTGADLKGTATLWDQPLEVTARFPAQGWLPAEATATATNWQLPAARVGLGAPYAQVRGDAHLVWRENAWDLSLAARAEPAAEPKTSAPPFTARAAAHGTLRELTLTLLAVDAPFATATLSAPVTFSFDQPAATTSALLTVRADLAKLPWFGARGQVEGTVRVNGDPASGSQHFDLKLTDVAVKDLSVRSAVARGEFHWPRLELAEVDVQLDESSRVQAHGAVNWQTRELSGVAFTGKLTPAWFARWLPTGFTWSTAEMSATVEGPLAAPQHAGTIKLSGVTWAPLHPVALDAAWQGEGAQAEIRSARLAAGLSAVELAGALDQHGLQLSEFRLTAEAGPLWQLDRPARLIWSPAWQLDDLQLSGPAGSLALKGRSGAEGFFNVTAAGFDSTWLQDWVTVPGPTWQLHSLATSGKIVADTLNFTTALTAQIAMEPRAAQVKFTANGDAEGVRIQELSVVDGERVLTQATGRVPLTWKLSREPRLQFDPAAPLELAGSTEPDSPLWATLAAATGLQLTRLLARFNLHGTLHQPSGNLQIAADQLSLAAAKTDHPVPEATALALDLTFDRSQVTLTNFSAQLDGQAVSATGRMPMNEDRWQQLWREPAAIDWSGASGRLEIPDADFAPFALRAPQFFASRGHVKALVELQHGKFSGELHLIDVASRPLHPFGTLQEINADLTLADRTLTVQRLTAKLGGEPVTIDGRVEFSPGAAPRLNLGLRAVNLPLVRSTGLLVRNDLDLQARTDSAGVTRLTGTVTLRDCLVLASLDQLLPTGLRGVARRPPYFAVDIEPYRHRPLDIAVRGPGAVRVRTAVFSGIASAVFHLGGTLGEPRAVGALTLEKGEVLFPFATFKVQSGTVRLSEADPFTAAVNLTATVQQRNHRLRLAVTGSLPRPDLALSSTPALAADEVLLMVMTGQPPGGADAASGTQRLALVGAYFGRSLFQELGIGGGDRLEISAGAQVTQQGRETYQVEYKLGRDWSLVGEYDQYDSYNAGLKWRVFTQDSLPDDQK